MSEIKNNNDRFKADLHSIHMPLANITKTMKDVLPQGTKIACDAQRCVQECVTEFIGFVSEEAAEHCCENNRKVLSQNDILWAVNNLGFDMYLEPLKQFIQEEIEQTTSLSSSTSSICTSTSTSTSSNSNNNNNTSGSK